MSAPTQRSMAENTQERILELQIRIADLECQLANREARIAALIAAGDANGIDHTRPGWK